ncbi:MAG: hypothetical protein IPM66_22605 [Acidobacteriota bacterium]|nr:MAG: hypothetical protein IPM66_22605 [Acidobacteriota bacterium]
MKRVVSIIRVIVLMAVILPAGAWGQTKSIGQPVKRQYQGNIIYFDGPRGSIVTQFTLRIDRVTPRQDVDRYLEALKRGGQDGLKKAIDGKKVGSVQVGTGLARDANAIWVRDDAEGKKITVLFERWMGFGELRRGARSVDYPFTYIEIFLDEKGRGEGTLIPAARVRIKSSGDLDVENFGTYPAKLVNLK